jgi:hypothetical protein
MNITFDSFDRQIHVIPRQLGSNPVGSANPFKDLASGTRSALSRGAGGLILDFCELSFYSSAGWESLSQR